MILKKFWGQGEVRQCRCFVSWSRCQWGSFHTSLFHVLCVSVLGSAPGHASSPASATPPCSPMTSSPRSPRRPYVINKASVKQLSYKQVGICFAFLWACRFGSPRARFLSSQLVTYRNNPRVTHNIKIRAFYLCESFAVYLWKVNCVCYAWVVGCQALLLKVERPESPCHILLVIMVMGVERPLMQTLDDHAAPTLISALVVFDWHVSALRIILELNLCLQGGDVTTRRAKSNLPIGSVPFAPIVNFECSLVVFSQQTFTKYQ